MSDNIIQEKNEGLEMILEIAKFPLPYLGDKITHKYCEEMRSWEEVKDNPQFRRNTYILQGLTHVFRYTALLQAGASLLEQYSK